jgi:hypothetical protein
LGWLHDARVNPGPLLLGADYDALRLQFGTYYRLVKAVEDDPNLPKKKAAGAAGVAIAAIANTAKRDRMRIPSSVLIS